MLLHILPHLFYPLLLPLFDLAAFFFLLVFLDSRLSLITDQFLGVRVLLKQENVFINVVSHFADVVLNHLLPRAQAVQFLLKLLDFFSFLFYLKFLAIQHCFEALVLFFRFYDWLLTALIIFNDFLDLIHALEIFVLHLFDCKHVFVPQVLDLGLCQSLAWIKTFDGILFGLEKALIKADQGGVLLGRIALIAHFV